MPEESAVEVSVQEGHHYRTMAVNERKAQARMNRKPRWVVLFCNLFLTLTVMFFQPLDDLTVNIRTNAFPVWSIWWQQLLFSIVIAMILSFLMWRLPAKAEKITAPLSLGLGISFLLQSLLFNKGWPFDMSTKWEMQIGCVMIWFWIVLLIVTTSYYFFETKDTIADIVIIAVAWFLIVAQAVNFTMLETSYDALARGTNYLHEAQYEQYIQPKDMDLIHQEGYIMKVSMHRGMPFLIKDNFHTEQK